MHVSFEAREYTANADAVGPLRILEAVRNLDMTKDVKFYHGINFGIVRQDSERGANESTPFYPRSPYGVAKLYAYWITVNYREAYDIFASNGILFNHESPLRGETFVTKKITTALLPELQMVSKRRFILATFLASGIGSCYKLFCGSAVAYSPA